MWLLNKLKIFEINNVAEKIVDAEEIKEKYTYWRWRTFYSMYMGYAVFYLSRKSFTFVMPVMIEQLHFTKADLGILGSILYFSYGISKFVSGILSDRSNPQYFMGTGLIATGICNICFGLSSSILFFSLFWGLNGWFQGWGWPPCAKLLTHWYAKNERGRWWGFWNTSHNLGGALIPLIVIFIANYGGWRMAMYIPGVICIFMGIVLMNRLRNTPVSLGLPSIEEYKGDGISSQDLLVEKMTKKQLLMDVVLRNKYIWVLGCAYFFVYVIRTAINDWGQLYLYEQKGFSLLAAGACIFSFEIGGFLGSLFSGWLSDTVFQGRRGPVNALCTLFVVLFTALLWIVPLQGVIFAHLMMFSIGFFIFGPQMMIGIAAAEMSHKKAAGSATGFVGCFAYVGAAAAGYPFGKIAEDYGWDTFIILLVGCGVVAFTLLVSVWAPQKKRVTAG